MRHLSIVILITLIALVTAPIPMLADEPTHSCTKAEKSCCKEKADCCKTADADCCKAAKSCCNGSTCCKDKSCETKKAS